MSNDKSRRQPVSARNASSRSDALSSSSAPFGASTESQCRKRVSLDASDLGIVLDRLGQNGGITRLDQRRAPLVERLEDRRDAALGIDEHALALEIGERGGEIGARVQPHGVAEMLAHRIGDLVGRDEQVGGAVRADQRIGERDRGARDILATDVERPGDRIKRGQHGGVGTGLGQRVRHLLPARASGCTTSRASEGAGRSGQIVSTGLVSTATSSAPRAASWVLACATQPFVCSHGS